MNSKQSRRLLAVLGIGAVLTLAAGAASFGAQTTPRDLPASPPQSETQTQNRDQGTQGLRPYAPRDRDGGRFGRRGNPVERRLAFLHERLNIRANQETVWDSFADAVRSEAQAMRGRFENARERFRDRRDGARRGDDRRGPPSVVERLERRQEMLADQSARVDHLLQAIRPLYAALDQNQKRTADRLFFRAGGMGMMGGEQGRFFNRRVPGPGAGGFDRGNDPGSDRDGNDGGNL
jgi:hypothetical protein